MKRDLYEKLIRRAKRLLTDAIRDANEGYYDLALVYLEQAVQLLLKAQLLKKVGSFPRIHDIKLLLNLLGENELLEENIFVITLLEDAYLGGRYLLREYTELEFEKALDFVKKLFDRYGIRI